MELKMMLCREVSKSLISSGVNFYSSTSDTSTMTRAPTLISVRAGTSYRQMNFSPRYLMERKVLKRMAVMAFVEIKTKSA